jgi:hypothetical protein
MIKEVYSTQSSVELEDRWYARAGLPQKTHRAVYGQTYSGQPGVVSRDRSAKANLRSRGCRVIRNTHRKECTP